MAAVMTYIRDKETRSIETMRQLDDHAKNADSRNLHGQETR